MRACILAVLCLLGCVQPSKVIGVACSTSADCVVGGVAGTCETPGFCSYPDPACTGGQRYSPGAGDGLGNTCLGGEIPCGAMGQACCAGGAGSLCGADLECDGASMTCVCGGEGQTCCANDACASNLACADAGTCECGGIGEPCCGGSTCDSGVTCNTGTCESGVIDVGVGMGHVCALRGDRSVWCWGGDYRAFMNLVPNGNSIFVGGPPHRIGNLTDVAALGSSEFSVCARKMDGTVWCWGHGESGQLGDGTFGGKRHAVHVTGLTNVTMLEGGRFHECAVGAFNGTQGLWCWGRGGHQDRSGTGTVDLGRLGNNDVIDQNRPVAVDLSAAASGGQAVRSLSVGSYASCIAMSDNTVWCWGRAGSGGPAANSKVPVMLDLSGVTIPIGVTIDEVSCSDGNSFSSRSSCFRLSNGAVYCWGASSQMGDGTATSRPLPTTPVDFTALAADMPIELTSGFGAHCVRTQASDLWCWGEGQGGLLGIGDSTQANALTPAKVLAVSNVVHVDLSHRTGCAVDTEQRLWCWGNNYRGQILGGTPRAFTPIEVKP